MIVGFTLFVISEITVSVVQCLKAIVSYIGSSFVIA